MLLEYFSKSCFFRDENSRIGDIIIRAGPFLRMYALYIDNYSIAIETIKTWKERSHEFARIVEAVESLPDCENLPLEVNKKLLKIWIMIFMCILIFCTLGTLH